MERSCPLGITHFVPQEQSSLFWCLVPYSKSFIDQACSVKMAGYWPCSFLARVMDLDFVSVHKHTKRELGQYPAILTSRLVNNLYIICIVFALAGEKPYQCDLCDMKFRLNSTLKRHWQRIHSGSRPYKCTECSKTFAAQTDFAKHTRSHTGPRRYIYSCKQCNRSFTAKNSLNDHMLIHTGEKPFSCDKCGMSFRYRKTFKNHYITHSNGKHNV